MDIIRAVEKKNYTSMFKTIAILTGLVATIITPRILTGYWFLNQAGLYLKKDQSTRAAMAFEDAAMRLGWNKSLYEEAAILDWGLGDVQEAGRLFNLALEQGRLSDAGYLTLGDLYLKQEKTQAALDAWSTIPVSSRSYNLALARLASTQQSQGAYELAEETWQRLVQVDSENAGAHYALGLLLMTSQPQAALHELIEAGSLDPGLESRVGGLRGNLTRAVLVGDRAYQLVISGQALAAVEEWGLARLAFTNGTLANPVFAEAWCWLGEADQQINRDGSPSLKKGLALNPDSTTCLALMALSDRRNNRFDEAWTIYEKLSHLEPANPAWMIALGDLSVQKGDLVSARFYYQAAIELGGNDPQPWKAMASFSIQYSVDVETLGLKAAYHLLDLSPKEWESEDLVGQALTSLGTWEAAREHFQKALLLAPDQAEIHLHLGYLYLLMAKYPESYEQLSRASQLNADGGVGEAARRLLAQYFP